MKTQSKNVSRKTSETTVQKRGTPGDHGNLSREEKTNLLLQAKDAYNHQQKLNRIEPGTTFDEWRRDMIMDRVSKGGISKLVRSEFRDVKALFLELSGREDEAFELLNKTGVKSYRPKSKHDTWETSETYVHLIMVEINTHGYLAATSLEDIARGCPNSTPFNFESPPNWFSKLKASKDAIDRSGKGPITTAWLLAAARQRTGKPSLTINTMAERLDPQTLCGLLAHVRNHISLREGRADRDRRSPRSTKKSKR